MEQSAFVCGIRVTGFVVSGVLVFWCSPLLVSHCSRRLLELKLQLIQSAIDAVRLVQQLAVRT